MRAVLRLCELYPGICLTTDKKARKNLSWGSTWIFCLQLFESCVMVELAAVAPYVVGELKKIHFLKINIFTIHRFLWRQFCGIKTGKNEFYNISWLVGRYEILGTGEKWTKEQVKQQCVTFALIAIVSKGSERYIHIYKGKGHPITGHQGPRGWVEV
jgi:hypothetical protein